MPLYDYQCKECGELFEIRATIKEKIAGLNFVCPKCGSADSRQLLTAAMVLHGSQELSRSGCGPNAGPGCCG